MIINIEGSRFLTNSQWLKLMHIVGDKEMELRLPEYDNDACVLIYDGIRHIIQADGTTRQQIV